MEALATLASQADRACPPDGYRLSLVIPAWNEAETIAQAIQEAQAALGKVTADFEIIVVDDGSTDRTSQIVLAAAAADRRVRLVQHQGNQGYGAALASGFRAARLDLVAFTDADCQFDLNELEDMLPLSRRYDLVCGTRIDRQDPPQRLFYSWGYNSLVKLLLGSPVPDIDCALKIFRRESLEKILPEARNFFVNTEMLYRARRLGLRIGEVGVHHRPRAAGESKVSLLAVPRTLGSLLPFWWNNVLFPARLAPIAAAGFWFWAALLCLALVAGVQLFHRLQYPLIEPDEARYAEIAREMLASGDYLVPRLFSEPYLDKPPLLYWLLAGSYSCFGISDWSARLPPAAAAWLTVLVTFVFGSRTFGVRRAFLGALALTLSIGFVCGGRFLILDSLLSLCVSTSLFAAFEAIRGDRLRWGWWLLSAVACGLGAMTKGPIAVVLLAPPVMAYAWIARLPARPRLAHWSAYAAASAAVVLPWFFAIASAVPNFAYHFFWEHHVYRFMNGLNHVEPFWYYIPVLLLGGLPWSLLVVAFGRYLVSRSPAVSAVRPAALGFFLLWASWCLAFFTASSCKLPTYILPLLPATALMLGSYLEHVLFAGAEELFSGAFRHVRQNLPRYATMVLCGGWIIAIWCMRGHVHVGLAECIAETTLCAAVLCAVGLAGKRMSPRLAWGLCCAATLCVTSESAGELIPAWARHRAALPRTDELAEVLRDPRNAVVVWANEWGSVPFYLERNDVRRFDYTLAPEFTRFLQEHSRVAVVDRQRANIDLIRMAVPDDMRITQVGDAGRARIWLLERIRLGKTVRRAVPPR